MDFVHYLVDEHCKITNLNALIVFITYHIISYHVINTFILHDM